MRRGGGGGGGAARLFFFPWSANHERDYPPCKKSFFRVGNQYAANVRNGRCSEGLDAFTFFLNITVDPIIMLFPSGNPFICHEEVLY